MESKQIAAPRTSYGFSQRSGAQILFQEDAVRYVELITGNKNSMNHFSAIRKKAEGKEEIRILFGAIESLGPQLAALNTQGFNIFMAVNECGRVRNKNSITKVRSFFYDNDTDIKIDPNIKPSFRVLSGGGDHGYWLLSDEFPINEYESTQSSVAKILSTDPTVTDLSRLMRVPGYAHMKDPNNPKPVRLVEVTDRRYSAAEIKAAFPIEQHEVSHAKPLSFERSSMIAGKKFRKLVNQAPTGEGSANPFGGRNKTALLIVREGLALNLSKPVIYAGLAQYCRNSGLSETEVEDMVERQESEHKDKAFVPYFSNDDGKKPSTAALTEMFLTYESLKSDHIRYWHGDFYRYDGTKYQQLKNVDLKPRIIAFFNNTQTLKEKYKAAWADDIITHLSGIGHLLPDIEAGSDILEPGIKKHLVFLSNNILQLDERNEWQVKKLEHDPRYFSEAALPYAYDPNAQCPLFTRILGEIISDESTRNFLQEWFGYNLVHDTRQGKFVVLLGEGANGKSVVLAALTALVGTRNVSAVPLENFSAVRTFPLASTMGKLSNIVDEMGLLRGVEATLKQFVSGSIMNVERKGKDGFEQKPTARLTFATNSLPTFHDRSDGLWRRMIVIPMRVQILDESKQNKNFSDTNYWEQSDELPGILNWALDGLQRLMRRGHFLEPQSAKDFKNNFRQESDHVSAFIEEKIIASNQGQLGATHLYSEYSRYAQSNGYNLISPAAFANAIRRSFPETEKSQQPVTINGKRERVWSGIILSEQGGAF